MNPIQQAAVFLIQTIFNLYLYVLLFRFIFQYLRVDYYNPFSQLVLKLTSPVVVPLRRIIPGFHGIDFATLLVMFVVCYCKILLLSMISPAFPHLLGIIILTIGDLLDITVDLFFILILIYVIFSWLAPLSHSPLHTLLNQICEPLIRPARKWIPPIGGVDISPFVVLLILQLLNILITEPLTRLSF